MVLHPIRTASPRGARALRHEPARVGEGHISSIEFRTGVVDAASTVTLRSARPASRSPRDPSDDAALRQGVVPREARRDWTRRNDVPGPIADPGLARHEFTMADLNPRSSACRPRGAPHASLRDWPTIMRWLATRTTHSSSRPTRALSERVIFPVSENESPWHRGRALRSLHRCRRARHLLRDVHGVQRLRVLPQLIETDRLSSLQHQRRSTGRACRTRGWRSSRARSAAKFVMVSRPDGENIHLLRSPTTSHFWNESKLVHGRVTRGSSSRSATAARPIETDRGLAGRSPTASVPCGSTGSAPCFWTSTIRRRVIGELREPLLVPNARRARRLRAERRLLVRRDAQRPRSDSALRDVRRRRGDRRRLCPGPANGVARWSLSGSRAALDVSQSARADHSRAHPSRWSRAITRARTSSRISRTRAMGFPFGSSSGQSSRRRPGHDRALLAAAHRDQHLGAAARSSVSFCGVRSLRSMPTSRMASSTSGWTRVPGLGARGDGARLRRVGQRVEPGRRHLRAPGVVNAGEDHACS